MSIDNCRNPYIPCSPWGGGGEPLLSNPGTDEKQRGPKFTAEEARLHASVVGGKWTGVSFAHNIDSRTGEHVNPSNGASGGGGNGNTTTEDPTQQAGMLFPYMGMLEKYNAADPFTVPWDTMHKEFDVHLYGTGADHAGAVIEAAGDVAIAAMPDPLGDYALAAAAHRVGASIDLAKFARYSKYADDVCDVARISRRAENWESAEKVVESSSSYLAKASRSLTFQLQGILHQGAHVL